MSCCVPRVLPDSPVLSKSGQSTDKVTKVLAVFTFDGQKEAMHGKGPRQVQVKYN